MRMTNAFRPAQGPITSWAGKRNYQGAFGNDHFGVDIGGKVGDPIYAMFDGTVGQIMNPNSPLNKWVTVVHSNGTSAYLHNSAITVRVGQRVTRGQQIARMGSAGTGPHLHVEWHPNGWYNPNQTRINDLIRNANTTRSTPRKTNAQVAQEIADGKGGWGNNPQRANRLRQQGYNPTTIQNEVNRIINARRPAPVNNAGAAGTTRSVVVRRGDTLAKLASAHRTSVRALQFLNGIQNPNQIRVGQRLFVRWVVTSGQTLNGIASSYNRSPLTRGSTTGAQLGTRSGIPNAAALRPGHLIRLP